MDRLMCLQLQSSSEPVEVHVNGVPVLSLPAGGGSRAVTVHEFLQNGSNRLSLAIAPLPVAQAVVAPDSPAQPRLAARAAQARARLVLLRQGKSLADEAVRVLAEVAWAVQEGQSFQAPTVLHEELQLPVAFPRWRWLDAPAIAPTAPDRQQLLALLQRLAFDLARGQADSLVDACRLKLEEIDVAYQRPAGHGAAALRALVQQRWETGALPSLEPPTAETLLLRRVADGRLLDALNPLGAPALGTANDDVTPGNVAWPLRLTLIEGKAYVLR